MKKGANLYNHMFKTICFFGWIFLINLHSFSNLKGANVLRAYLKVFPINKYIYFCAKGVTLEHQSKKYSLKPHVWTNWSYLMLV